MKTAVKKSLAFLLAVVMVLGAAPLSGLVGLDFGSLFGAEASAANYSVGDIVKFGSYPQSKVTDSATLSALNSISKIWVSYGYYSGTDNIGSMVPGDWMKYADVTYRGTKYRAVTFTQYRPIFTYGSSPTYTTNQEDNGYSVNTTYWFEFEPLEWRVLDPANGLVLCETIIDSQAFNNTIYGSYPNYYNNSSETVYASNYAKSTIRAWLNADFYNTAFTASEKKYILTTALNNTYDSEYSEYDSATTNDKVFLPSRSEMHNSAYGFSDEYYEDKRCATASEYAGCQGLNKESSYTKYRPWWLRTADNSYKVNSVNDGGCCGFYDGAVISDFHVCSTLNGIRPAIRISNLSALSIDEDFHVTEVALSKTYIALDENVATRFNVTVLPKNAKNKRVIWSSSDTSVVSVDSNGFTHTVDEGVAIVTATSEDTGVSDSCVVFSGDSRKILNLNFPQYMHNKPSSEYEALWTDRYQTIYSNISNGDALFSSLLTALDGGLEFDFKLAASELGLSESYEDENIRTAALELLSKISSNERVLKGVVDKVEAVYSPIKKGYKVYDAVNKVNTEKLIGDLAKSHKTITGCSDKNAYSYAEEFVKASESAKTMEAVSSVIDIADESLTIIKLAIEMHELYSIEIELINTLMENVNSSSELYRGLSLVKNEREKLGVTNPAFVYFEEQVIKAVAKSLGKALGTSFGVGNAILKVAAYVLNEYLFDGQSATDYIKGAHYASFAVTMRSSLNQMCGNFINMTADADDVDLYEALYNARIDAMRLAADSAYSYSNNAAKKNGVYPYRSDGVCGKSYSYNVYLNSCLNTLANDIMDGKVNLSGVYAANNPEVSLANIKKIIDYVKSIFNNTANPIKNAQSVAQTKSASDDSVIYQVEGNNGSFKFIQEVFSLIYDANMPSLVNYEKRYLLSSENNVELKGSLKGSEVNSTSAANLILSQVQVGDIIVGYGKYGLHCMLVVDWSTNKITVYDCDSHSTSAYVKNQIQQYDFSFEDFANEFSSSVDGYEAGIALYSAQNRNRIFSDTNEEIEARLTVDDGNFIVIDGVLTEYRGSSPVINIPEGVVEIASECFYGNRKITEVVLPSTISIIGESAFSGCTNLRNVTSRGNITEIKAGAFEGCSVLSRIELGNKLVNIGVRSFKECSSLGCVILPPTLKTIDESAFEKCSILNDIIIPDGIVTVGVNAFALCENLKDVYIPNKLISSDCKIFIGSDLVPAEVQFSIVAPADSMKYKTNMKLSVLNLPDSYKVEYASSDSSIAKVDSLGNVFAVSDGMVTITGIVTDADGAPILNDRIEYVTSSVQIKCTMTFFQKVIKWFKSLFGIADAAVNAITN